MNNAAAIAAAFGGGLPPGISGTNDRCTLLASSLNPDVSSLFHTSAQTHKYTKALPFYFVSDGDIYVYAIR